MKWRSLVFALVTTAIAACDQAPSGPRAPAAPAFDKFHNPDSLNIYITRNDGDPAGYGTGISTTTALKIGQSLALKAVVRDSLGHIVTTSAVTPSTFHWTYDNNACIKVDQNGVATAVRVKPFSYNNPTAGAAYVTYRQAFGGVTIRCDTLP